MNFNLTYLSEDNVNNDLSACVDILLGGKSKELNVTVDAKDAVEHFEWFQRQLFLANLLDIHGFFIKGALKNDILQSISDLYGKTKFSFLGHWLYPNTISLTNLTTSDNLTDCEVQPLSKDIRAIICWNGKGELTPDDQLMLKFDAGNVLGSVAQIQKVIKTDFAGSSFGINKLNGGQVGTVSMLLEKDIEKVLYACNHAKGFFVIVDESDSLQLGIGIVIKE